MGFYERFKSLFKKQQSVIVVEETKTDVKTNEVDQISERLADVSKANEVVVEDNYQESVEAKPKAKRKKPVAKTQDVSVEKPKKVTPKKPKQ